ncbi:phage major capsid protein [Cereibacter sphaeroides]|nr:phage major capsid protein [Cereibacter sphaeroides]
MSDRIEIKAALTVEETGEITGLAWPFGTPDRVGDVIEKGAFTGPAELPMLFAHDQTQVIGVWDQIAETPEGLTVKGRLLVQDVERAREVRAMIRAGAVSGLSIGFETEAAKPRARGRSISKLRLLEVSVVAVPCHPGAQIHSIKAADDTAEPCTEGKTPVENEDQTTPANAPEIDTKAFDALKQRLDQLEAKANRPGVTTTGPAPSAEAKAFGGYVRRGVERMDPADTKSLTVSTAANGGYLAPKEFGDELFKNLIEFSPIRKYARVVQISAPEITYPKRVTGTSATWVSEVGDRTGSEPSFDQVTLTPHELATFSPNALLEDNAYNLEGELMADFAESFGRAESAAFVNGDGVGKPKGIMAAAGIATLSGGAGTITVASLIEAYHAIPTVYAQNAVWVMNRTTLAKLRTYFNGMGEPLLLDSISEKAPTTLLGRPVVEAPDMPNMTAGATPILFGDLSGYRIVDRVGLAIMRDPFSLATKGQVRFHARKRVGADLTHPDRFVKLKVAA